MISSISSWVLSICGICISSVLIDIILPNGSTNKYIKSVFAFIVIFIIISPLPKLLKKGIDIDSIFQESNIVLQDEYIYNLNRKQIIYIENQIEKSIEREGLSNVEVVVSANIFNVNMKIDAVYVDLRNLVIKEDMQHINTNEVITKCICKYIQIEKEKIIFNE